MTSMGIYFVSYYVNIALSSPKYGHQWYVAAAFQGLAVIAVMLYLIVLLAWKLLGGKLQAVMGKAKVMWGSIVHHTHLREQSGSDGIEPFDRELDTSEDNSYPPLLEGSQNPTY